MARDRRRRRGKNDIGRGILLGLIGVTMLTGLAGAAYWVRRTADPLDEANCPRSGPKSIHAILFDRSDPISDLQAQRIRQVLEQARKDAAVGSRFDLFTFDGDTKSALNPLLSICVPPKPEDAKVIYQNPERVRQRYIERFTKVLDEAIKDLLQAKTQPSSPIIESLKSAAQTSFGGLENADLPRRMTLISDMVQHTDMSSHFREEPVFEKLAKSGGWPVLRPDLRQADVDILYILRPSAQRRTAPIQNRGHQLFWEQLIAASNGHLRKIEPL